MKKQFLNLLFEALHASKKNQTIKDVFNDFIRLTFVLCVENLSKNPFFGYKTESSSFYSLEKLTVKEISYLLEATRIYFKMVRDFKPFVNVLGELGYPLELLESIYEEQGKSGFENLQVAKKDIDENVILIYGVQVISNILYHQTYIQSMSLFHGEDLYFQIQRKEPSLMGSFLNLMENRELGSIPV